LGIALVAASIGINSAPPPLARAAVDIGYEDQSFSGASGSPSGSKPESKLWWNDGFWWASMYDIASTDFHIFRLNLATQQWTDTGTALDDRPGSRADTLWDDANGKLYVASHVFTGSSSTSATGKPARLTASATTLRRRPHLDAAFPVTINDVSSGDAGHRQGLDRQAVGDVDAAQHALRRPNDGRRLHWGRRSCPGRRHVHGVGRHLLRHRLRAGQDRRDVE
jgi:hypothetical protein